VEHNNYSLLRHFVAVGGFRHLFFNLVSSLSLKQKSLTTKRYNLNMDHNFFFECGSECAWRNLLSLIHWRFDSFVLFFPNGEKWKRNFIDQTRVAALSELDVVLEADDEEDPGCGALGLAGGTGATFDLLCAFPEAAAVAALLLLYQAIISLAKSSATASTRLLSASFRLPAPNDDLVGVRDGISGGTGPLEPLAVELRGESDSLLWLLFSGPLPLCTTPAEDVETSPPDIRLLVDCFLNFVLYL